VLRLLVRTGVAGIRGELAQACFKTLSLLFEGQIELFAASPKGLAGGKQARHFGLEAKQLKALLVLLRARLVSQFLSSSLCAATVGTCLISLLQHRVRVKVQCVYHVLSV
jgi:hypothetical protein